MTADLTTQVRENPGSEKHWAQWYRAMYPKLYYAAYRLTRGNTETAGDLTQATFERFIKYRAIDRIASDRHAIAFLVTTCRHLAFDHGASARQIPLDDINEALDVPTESSTEDTLDLDRILRQLDPEDRQLMEWARDGVVISEIATKLGITYTAAGVRLHRLRKRIREQLEPT